MYRAQGPRIRHMGPGIALESWAKRQFLLIKRKVVWTSGWDRWCQVNLGYFSLLIRGRRGPMGVRTSVVPEPRRLRQED